MQQQQQQQQIQIVHFSLGQSKHSRELKETSNAKGVISVWDSNWNRMLWVFSSSIALGYGVLVVIAHLWSVERKET